MPIYKAIVELQHVSDLPEDVIANQFIVGTPIGVEIVQSNSGLITFPLDRFYDVALPGDAAAWSQFLGAGLNRAAGITTRIYDVTDHLDGTPHGSPVAVANAVWNTPPVTPDVLPEECALNLNLEAWFAGDPPPVEVPDNAFPFDVDDPDAAPDRPRQRRSGSVVLGPFGVLANETVAGKARPDDQMRAQILEAAQRLALEWRGGGGGTTPVEWLQWSRKNAAVSLVERVWLDNSWDTQRSRGAASTSRTTVSVL